MAAGLLLFAGLQGCKEQGPIIDFGNIIVLDSVFTVSPVPSTQSHNVLIEDFTGQSCANCPTAHTTIQNLENTYPGHINAISYYLYGGPQTYPPGTATNDFRDSSGYWVNFDFYGNQGSLPAGGIDRLQDANGAIISDYTLWPGNVASQIPVADSVNLLVESSWNSISGQATIKATVIWLKQMTSKQYLSIAVVEDSMYDVQDDGISSDPHYLFNDVCRGMVTKFTGDGVLDTMAVKAPGQAIWLKYTYTPKNNSPHPAIVPKNCRVIAFVANNSGTQKLVLQSAQTPLGAQ